MTHAGARLARSDTVYRNNEINGPCKFIMYNVLHNLALSGKNSNDHHFKKKHLEA